MRNRFFFNASSKRLLWIMIEIPGPWKVLVFLKYTLLKLSFSSTCLRVCIYLSMCALLNEKIISKVWLTILFVHLCICIKMYMHAYIHTCINFFPLGSFVSFIIPPNAVSLYFPQKHVILNPLKEYELVSLSFLPSLHSSLVVHFFFYTISTLLSPMIARLGIIHLLAW